MAIGVVTQGYQVTMDGLALVRERIGAAPCRWPSSLVSSYSLPSVEAFTRETRDLTGFTPKVLLAFCSHDGCREED